MSVIENIFLGFQQLLSVDTLLYLLAGVFIGNIAGMLPGLGATSGTAILLPLTFGMDALNSLVMLSGIYYGTMYGGSISAILLNVPGTTAAAITSIEGHAMARRGQAGKALLITFLASFIGGIISTIFLAFGGQSLARYTLRFSAPEFFALALMGLALVTGITGDYPLKGYIMLFVGLLLGTVGIDTISGVQRFTFNNIFLLDGLAVVPTLVGLFGFGEVFSTLESNLKQRRAGTEEQVSGAEKARLRDHFLEKGERREFAVAAGEGTLLGFFVGFLPGAGATIATVLAYGLKKKSSKKKELFGNGSVEGLAIVEAANNASTGGAILPMLCLGIPGSAATAVLLTALLMFGITPGPNLFTNNANTIWALIASMFLGNVLLLVMNILGIPLFTLILKYSKKVLLPVVGVLCFIGAYSLNNSVFEVGVMAFFGVVGYLLKKFDFPGLPLILGLILGATVETSLRQGLIMSDNDWSIFFTRPISMVFMAITILMLVWPIIYRAILQIKAKRAENK